MSDETAIESGASAEGSVSPESSSPATTQETAPVASEPTTPDVPFHEHPRFKELVTQKNEAAREAAQLKEAYQQVYSKLSQLEKTYQQQSQPQKPSYEPLFKQLEQTNPEFAAFIQDQYKKAQSVDTLSERLAQQEQFVQEYQKQQALSQFEQLCQENKVPAQFKSFYKAAVANQANASGAPLTALPEIFKAVHQEYSKAVDEYSREITKQYVTQKSQDKKAVNQPSGPAAPPRQSSNAMTKDDVKRQLAEAIRARNSA